MTVESEWRPSHFLTSGCRTQLAPVVVACPHSSMTVCKIASQTDLKDRWLADDTLTGVVVKSIE